MSAEKERELTEEEKKTLERHKTISQEAGNCIRLVGDIVGMSGEALRSVGDITQEDAVMILQGILLGSLDLAAKARAHVVCCEFLDPTNRDEITKNATDYFIKQCKKHEEDLRNLLKTRGL